MLGRAVRRVARHAESPEHRRHVDDPAAVGHQRRRLTRHQERAPDIRVENAAPARGLGLVNRLAAAGARVVHEHVDAIADTPQLRESGFDRAFIGHVHRQQHGLGALRANRLRRLLELRARARGDRHPAPGLGKRQRDGAADAAAAAGDDNRHQSFVQ